MRIRYCSTALAILLAPWLLAGCGAKNATPIAPAARGSIAPAASTKLTIAIPAAGTTTSSSRRRPNFVASTTAGVFVQTYAQSDSSHSNLLSQTATDISSGSSACGGQTGTPRTCTIPFSAPAGADTFVVTSYDAAPKNGSFTGSNQLASASVNQTINSAAANVVNVTLGGVLKSLVVSVPNQQIRGTVSSAQNVVVEALDANGNVIVSDGYMDVNGNPVSIALSLSPNTGNVFTLGAASLSSPQPSGVQVSYNGAATAAFTTTLSATAGSVHATGNIAVLGPAFASSAIPTAGSNPFFISLAPYSSQNGNLWFTESTTNKVGSITPTGTVVDYPLSGVKPYGIAAGPLGDTHLWIADYGSSQIESVGTDGVLHGVVSTLTSSAGPYGITTGPDGNMWFTENKVGKIGKITMSFGISEYPTSAFTSAPLTIATGPDGNLWFTDSAANAIGKITTSGVATEYPTPTGGSYPWGIVAGPDGNLWFTEYALSKIGVISPTGTIHEYPLPTNNAYPTAIAAGADGNLWFLEAGPQKLGRITTLASITEFPTSAVGPLGGIVAGPDNNLWFTEGGDNKVGTFAW